MNPADTGASALDVEPPALPWEAEYDPSGRLALLTDLRDLATGNGERDLALPILFMQEDDGSSLLHSLTCAADVLRVLASILTDNVAHLMGTTEKPIEARMDAEFIVEVTGLLHRTAEFTAEAARRQCEAAQAKGER